MRAKRRPVLTAVTRLNIVPTAKRYGGEPVPPLRRKRQPTETAELGESLTRALLTLAVLKTTGMGGNG